ncbi:Retrovirus-related Pol polyprotein from transposon TNT 1-94 Includes: RecName: Full=Protease; Includes: RecName: Full=Reverse transcriptase; Includes: RecName: Full=Endonuclease [Serendipita indica DSM 11827]|nr:Retrovirus-related Pol polyprotein from transposon TNT 1-94 Includes: RecName: Full=Protease; Includes: RecName: Full=Reverse transcriptase; Includes: RecName: Full=Endonuclease [Serendipita indica DSM 11827]
MCLHWISKLIQRLDILGPTTQDFVSDSAIFVEDEFPGGYKTKRHVPQPVDDISPSFSLVPFVPHTPNPPVQPSCPPPDKPIRLEQGQGDDQDLLPDLNLLDLSNSDDDNDGNGNNTQEPPRATLDLPAQYRHLAPNNSAELPRETKRLLEHFEKFPGSLPGKRQTRSAHPAYNEIADAAQSTEQDTAYVLVSLADGFEYALQTSAKLEPNALAEALERPDTFLNGEIDAEVYMQPPEGLTIHGDSDGSHQWVLRLLKGLYGIKQGPRLWSVKLHRVLSEIGFERLECDHSVFVYQRDGVRIIIPVHVDGLILASMSHSAIHKVKEELKQCFKIHDQGQTTQILGIRLERDRTSRTIALSQPAYIQKLLEDYNMTDRTPSPTRMPDGLRLSAEMSPKTAEQKERMKSIPYREAVGRLLYLSIATRPDISYAVGVLCRYNSNPGEQHWNAVKHVLRYLKGSQDLKLICSPTSSTDFFTAHSDADLSGNPDNSRSTGGYVLSVGSGAVMWGNPLQRHVSLSSTESEYTTASAAGCEIMWMRQFLEEIGYDISIPSPLYLDSPSAIQVVKNPEHQTTMKHVHRAYNWIRERVENGELCAQHVPTSENVADIFIKPLGRIKFEYLRGKLGLS